ncbi:MAG: sulfur carrier protein ThiS [Bryobacterales bacterium]|nr:sulfur carrier protein ThiS [Bryobacterales bacterium]
MPENQTNPIEIVVNGARRSVPPGLTLAALLAELGVEGGRVAVELNREIVRKSVWAETVVDAGAELEIVQFVGGGVR